MADMELVIKISEDSYKATCNGYMLPLDVENVVQGIKNGTPLEQKPTNKIFTKADIDAIVKAINAGWELRVNEVLDEIRSEIEQLSLHKAQYLTSDNKVCIDSQDVFNVFDKYKAEIEQQESEDNNGSN